MDKIFTDILPLVCLNHSAALELRRTVSPSDERSPAVDMMESDTRCSDGRDEATRRLGESENNSGSSDWFQRVTFAQLGCFIFTIEKKII